jgi:membrane protease YdiL (CAAX protease family)
MAGQMAGLAALTWWYTSDLGGLPEFGNDGVAVTLIVVASTVVEMALLAAFAKLAGGPVAAYLGLTLPRRSDLVVGVAAVVAFIVLGNSLSWLLGRDVVTPFQSDIYRSAAAAGWLSWLWIAIVLLTPVGEETLFRGFLFRGWLRSPRDAWPVIALTALLFAAMHVQYDWYVMSHVFVFGLILGWLRWATGSTLLCILLHALVNLEGMLETLVSLQWQS